jgi:adenylyltransferase/sulfurtransferase
VDSVLNAIPRDREVIVYCRSGVRSVDVISSLREVGFDPRKLVNLEGGIISWARTVDHSIPVY